MSNWLVPNWVQAVLTEREKQLLRRLAERRSDSRIAAEIGGKREQIAAQRERLLAKLGISSDTEIKAAATSLARWPYRQNEANASR